MGLPMPGSNTRQAANQKPVRNGRLFSLWLSMMRISLRPVPCTKGNDYRFLFFLPLSLPSCRCRRLCLRRYVEEESEESWLVSSESSGGGFKYLFGCTCDGAGPTAWCKKALPCCSGAASSNGGVGKAGVTRAAVGGTASSLYGATLPSELLGAHWDARVAPKLRRITSPSICVCILNKINEWSYATISQ